MKFQAIENETGKIIVTASKLRDCIDLVHEAMPYTTGPAPFHYTIAPPESCPACGATEVETYLNACGKWRRCTNCSFTTCAL